MSGKNSREDLPKQRASVILRVLNGEIGATAASKLLGISRKSYYKWQKRALRALLGALDDSSAGRPSNGEGSGKGCHAQARGIS